LESQFLVEDELLLEAFLALVERSHACLAISGAAGRSRIGSQPFGRDACRVNLERLQHPALEPRAALHSGTQSSRQPTAKGFAPAGARATKPFGAIVLRSPIG